MAIQPFTEEQARLLVNLRQRYEVWMEGERVLAAIPYDLRRKEVDGRFYLYEIADRSGNGKSLGAWSPEHEARLNAYRRQKTEAKSRIEASRGLLEEACRLGRALRVPMMASSAGEILRECDRRQLLGEQLLVVGTNAMPAYTVEAAGFLRDAPDETDDFDLAWSASTATDGAQVWNMLKAVDPSFTVNTERPFQARNAEAYEVELLIAPSRASTYQKTDRPRPTPLPEQEWLLLGRPVDHVVVCRDGTPARIVAPDPRWFALQKLWMSDLARRNPLKRPKDRKQGLALLDAVADAMPQFPMDAVFERDLPPELAPHYAAWRKGRRAASKTPRRAQ